MFSVFGKGEPESEPEIIEEEPESEPEIIEEETLDVEDLPYIWASGGEVRMGGRVVKPEELGMTEDVEAVREAMVAEEEREEERERTEYSEKLRQEAEETERVSEALTKDKTKKEKAHEYGKRATKWAGEKGKGITKVGYKAGSEATKVGYKAGKVVSKDIRSELARSGKGASGRSRSRKYHRHGYLS